MRYFLIRFVLLLPMSAQAALFTVGTDTSCSHTTIQAAIDAAAAAPGADTIRIARNQTYIAQQLLINSQTLTITGGAATCATAPDGSLTLISGAGGGFLPVLRISTTSDNVVTLQFLQITGGDAGGNGGGISYIGSNDSRLVIENSTISGNTAANGGGIFANGNGSRAHVHMGANTLVAGNTARDSGGGIFLSNANLSMNAPDSAIANNIAAQLGGGLLARAPSDVGITSGGISTLGTIFGNEARIGGGAAVITSDDNDLDVALTMTTVDSLRPVRIRGNLARELGGALYVRADNNGAPSAASALLEGVSIEENSAQTGAAAYLDTGPTAILLDPLGGSLTMIPSVGCAANSGCNRVIGNIAETIGGVATNGGILVGGDATSLRLTGTQILGNNGGPPVFSDDLDDNGFPIILENVLIANNVVRGDAIVRVVRGRFSIIDNSTIANNSLTGSNIIEAAGRTSLDRSILWQPGKTTLVTQERNVGRVLASETASLGATALLAINGEPRFVDPANNNFRLRAGSRAIDVAPAVAGDDRDADGLPRDQDLDLVANIQGVRDLGAFERQTVLPLVQNSDFVSDVRLWPEVVNNVSIFQSENSPGSSGSGSLRVTENGGSIAVLQARRQCVSLPGPSSYRLNGFGRGYSTGLFRDTLSLQWRLRANSSDCTGAVLAEGLHALPNSNGWASATQPTVIPLSSAQWTFNSTLEIILVATDDRVLPPNNIDVAFDQITLVPGAAVDAIFANGFE